MNSQLPYNTNKTNIYKVLWTFIILLSTSSLYSQFSGGSGTESDPFQIALLTDLKTLSENDNYWSKYFILVSDIDAADTRNWNIDGTDTLGFTPIGNSGTRFSGYLDGDGYTISNLYIKQTDNSKIGFFGYLEGAYIKNLNLFAVDVYGYDAVAGLAGYSYNSSIINCSVTGDVIADGISALLAGHCCQTTIKYCFSKGSVSNTSLSGIGGLIGNATYSSVKASYCNVNIQGTMSGGIVGISNNTSILNCFTAGSLLATYYSGGISAMFQSSVLNNSYSVCSITATYLEGGVVGYNDNSQVNYCFYDSVISTQTEALGYDNNNQACIGLPTKAFKKTNLFFNAGWDFDYTWEMGVDTAIDSITRPYLRMQLHNYLITTSVNIDLTATVAGESFYDLNDKVALKAEPANNYQFVGWQLNGTIVSSDNPYTFNCTGNAEYTAVMIEKFGAGGTGSKDDPFQISTIEQMQAMDSLSLSEQRYFVLINDIDASDTKNWNDGLGFDPIGSNELYFSGSLEGQGHIINNLYINRPDSSYIGLFANIEKGSISNVGLSNCKITGNNYVGAFAGYNYGSGSNNSDSICQCFSSGVITCKSEYGGGLVGYNYQGRMIACYSTAAVTAVTYAGGITGYSTGDGTTKNIAYCFASGLIEGNTSGGLIGGKTNNSFFKCCFDKNTTNQRWPQAVAGNMYAPGLTTENFADSSYLFSTTGIDSVFDWQYSVCHDGYKRPVLDWETIHTVKVEISSLSTGNGSLQGDTLYKLVHAGKTFETIAYPDSVSEFTGWFDSQNNLISSENEISFYNVLNDSTVSGMFVKRTGNYKINLTLVDNNTNILAGEELFFNGDYYVTDQDGRVTFYGLNNGDYIFQFTQTGYVSVTDTFTVAGADISETVRISALTTTITFKVTNNGDPVENATILITNNNLQSESYTFHTNENGIAYAYNFDNYSFNVEVTAVNYQNYSGSLTISNADVINKISLTASPDFIFNITDGTNPVENASVYFNNSTYTSNAGGSVICSNIVEGSYDYTVSAEGYLSREGSVTVSINDTVETVELEASEDTVHSVTFIFYNGTALVTSYLFLQCNDYSSTPDENGEITFLNFAPGTYTYFIYSIWQGSYYGKFTVTDSDLTITVDISQNTTPYYDVSVNITDGTSPIGNATVTIDGVAYSSDESGNVSIIGLHAGEYNYTASASGFQDITSSFKLIEDDTSFTITLVSDNTLTHDVLLKVTDGTNAIENATVSFNGTAYSTDANGEITITGLASGTCIYTVSATGYVDITDTCIVRDADISMITQMNLISYTATFIIADGDSIRLSSSYADIDGNIFNSSGGEIIIPDLISGTYNYTISANAYNSVSSSFTINNNDTVIYIYLSDNLFSVKFNIDDGSQELPDAYVLFNNTVYNADEDGVTTIISLENGSYNYTVSASGYESKSGTIEINGSDIEKAVSLEQSVITYYSVTFKIKCGEELLSGATVIFLNSTYTTNANGEITISDILPGTYSYSVEASGYETSSGTITLGSSNVTETITLSTAKYNVTFTVTDGTNPVSGVEITFNNLAYYTSANGNAVINSVENGSYNYEIESTGYESVSGTVVVAGDDVTEAIVLKGNTQIEVVSSYSAKVFPNPTNGMVEITSDDNQLIKLNIISITGELVHTSQLFGGGVVDLSDLNSGLYIIKMNLGHQTIVSKLIKE